MARQRLWTIILLTMAVFFASGIAAAQSGRIAPTVTPTPPDDDTERVLTEEIKLNVLAFDNNGGFFGDVRAEDLVISENNILHQPASVRRIPANVLIVLDTGGELRSIKTLDRTRSVASGIISALRDGDRIAIIQYSDKPQIICEWTSEKGAALASLKKSNFGRRSAFTDAVKMGTDYLTREPLDNKHMVLITDGTDTFAKGGARFDAFRRLRSTDVTVHVVSYTQMEANDIEPRTKGISKTPPPKALPDEVAATLPNGARDIATAPKVGPTISLDRSLIKRMKARQAELELAQEELSKLAEDTNGEFILPESVDEMVEKSALVARMIDSSYVVTYTPKMPVKATRGVAERVIDVTSKRAGLTVQARRRLFIEQNK